MKTGFQLRRDKGQSLVEMAITMPVLILMFVGLIEVGAALRNYLVVVNADREGTRFAARGRWFDSQVGPEVEDADDIFRRVVAAAGTESQGGQQVPFLRTVAVDDLPANTTIAVTYIEIPDQVDATGQMDASEQAFSYGPWYTGTLSYQSRIDVGALMAQKKQENYDFNQQYYVNQGLLDLPSEDNFVIVEVFYEHEQLLKLPIFTSILPESFPLYAQSTMRVTLDSRVQ